MDAVSKHALRNTVCAKKKNMAAQRGRLAEEVLNAREDKCQLNRGTEEC